jgi:anti-sigma regulatory factor (Ser/Thr protein kinase)
MPVPSSPAASTVPSWLRLGRCPVCGTSVLVDDEFVRSPTQVLHAECDRYRRTHGISSFSFAGGPRAALEARERLGATDLELAPSTRDRLLLLLTELVTNAVRHGGANTGRSVCVRVVRSPRSIRVCVTDPGRGFAWRGRPLRRPAADGGFGLVLVDRLAWRWGIQPQERSTTVWFELRRGDYRASALRRTTRGVAELE